MTILMDNQMKMFINKGSIFFIVLTSLILSGCSMVPEDLRVNDNAPLVSFADVRAEPNTNTGLNARWGGVIAKIENQKNRTMIEVVNFPLNSYSRPITSQKTQGRFKIYYKGLLDPVVYKKGKSVTAVGTIGNSEKGKIGEQDYVYPILNANYVHLWKKIKRVDVSIMQQPFWYTPSYWNYYPTYPYSTVIIERNGANKVAQPAHKKH